MEKQLFTVAVAAAKREASQGYYDKALDYLRSALGYANTMKDRRARAETMRAMNAIRAVERRQSAAPYADRAREITARERMVMGETPMALNMAICGLIGAILSLAVIAGFSLPTGSAAVAYDVVEMHGDESDVIDFDVSFSDCLSIALNASRDGRNVTCEAAR